MVAQVADQGEFDAARIAEAQENERLADEDRDEAGHQKDRHRDGQADGVVRCEQDGPHGGVLRERRGVGAAAYELEDREQHDESRAFEHRSRQMKTEQCCGRCGCEPCRAEDLACMHGSWRSGGCAADARKRRWRRRCGPMRPAPAVPRRSRARGAGASRAAPGTPQSIDVLPARVSCLRSPLASCPIRVRLSLRVMPFCA